MDFIFDIVEKIDSKKLYEMMNSTEENIFEILDYMRSLLRS